MVEQSLEIVLHENNRKISVNLTNEQRKSLDEYTKKWKREKPSLWSIGFLEPVQINSYFCNICQKTYEDKPIAKVCIPANKDWDTGEVKIRSATVGYHCSHCDEFVFIAILDPQRAGEIPEKYIVDDETGDYKKPTPESIEKLFKKIEKQAKEEYGQRIDLPPYFSNLDMLNRWGSKIGHKLDQERIDKLNSEWRERYIKELEEDLYELIEEIKQKSHDFTPEFIYEGDLIVHIEKLEETLKYTDLPKDVKLKQNILRILYAYEKMYISTEERLLEKKEEENKKLDEEIHEAESDRMDIRRKIWDFLDKAKLTSKQIEKAKDVFSCWDLEKVLDLENN